MTQFVLSLTLGVIISEILRIVSGQLVCLQVFSNRVCFSGKDP